MLPLLCIERSFLKSFIISTSAPPRVADALGGGQKFRFVCLPHYRENPYVWISPPVTPRCPRTFIFLASQFDTDSGSSITPLAAAFPFLESADTFAIPLRNGSSLLPSVLKVRSAVMVRKYRLHGILPLGCSDSVLATHKQNFVRAHGRPGTSLSHRRVANENSSVYRTRLSHCRP